MDEYALLSKCPSYNKKGYVRKVPEDEKMPKREWYLPRFAFVKPDRATIKTLNLFDESAKLNGTSLSDSKNQGPKLKRHWFDVPLRFCKHQVTIASDIAEVRSFGCLTSQLTIFQSYM